MRNTLRVKEVSGNMNIGTKHIMLGFMMALLIGGLVGTATSALANDDGNCSGYGNCHSYGSSSEGAGPGLQNQWGKTASAGNGQANYSTCPNFADADGDGICDNCPKEQ